jgi:hypothetical protein
MRETSRRARFVVAVCNATLPVTRPVSFKRVAPLARAPTAETASDAPASDRCSADRKIAWLDCPTARINNSLAKGVA